MDGFGLAASKGPKTPSAPLLAPLFVADPQVATDPSPRRPGLVGSPPAWGGAARSHRTEGAEQGPPEGPAPTEGHGIGCC